MRDIWELKIASYNVLFCPNMCIFKCIMGPKQRFEYQIETLLPSVGADILCLQEVRLEYLKMLRKSELGREYQISNYELGREKKHFPLILSRIPFTEILIRDRVIYALFEWKSTNFIVIWAHLNVFGKKRKLRAVELVNINQNLRVWVLALYNILL